MIVGNCLRALKDEFPRESYKIITKCGRYGDDGFDYAPQTIEKSVRRSLDRLGCGYLDVVCQSSMKPPPPKLTSRPPD